MTKFYRVVKDNFLWQSGAILEEMSNNDNVGFRPISDIWNTTEHNGSEYISARIVENNPEWFERVYKVDLLTKVVYEVKDKAQELMKRQFTE